jgi:hypothetical protein
MHASSHILYFGCRFIVRPAVARESYSFLCPTHGFADGHLLLYTLCHVEPGIGRCSGETGPYNELTLQLATAACHVQRPNRNSLTKTGMRLQNYRVVHMSGMYLRMCRRPCYADHNLISIQGRNGLNLEFRTSRLQLLPIDPVGTWPGSPSRPHCSVMSHVRTRNICTTYTDC